jgi:hypothetical protein
MTFTAQEATVVVTLAPLDADRPAGERLVETLRTFDLVERQSAADPDGVDPLGLPGLC